MKIIFVFFYIVIASQAKADVDFVPLDMELGYWEITTQVNLDEMLAKIPEEQRAMMRQMMASTMKIPVIKQCITQDTLNDPAAQMKELFKSAGADCELQVIKSTPQVFNGVLMCASGSTKVTISTKSINSKRHESLINTDMAGMSQDSIKTIGEWKSATCPDGVK